MSERTKENTTIAIYNWYFQFGIGSANILSILCTWNEWCWVVQFVWTANHRLQNTIKWIWIKLLIWVWRIRCPSVIYYLVYIFNLHRVEEQVEATGCYMVVVIVIVSSGADRRQCRWDGMTAIGTQHRNRIMLHRNILTLYREKKKNTLLTTYSLDEIKNQFK